MKYSLFSIAIVLLTANLYAQWEKVGWEGSSAASLIKDGNTYYCATRVGGVFRSTDEGASWQPINEGIEFDHYRLQTEKLIVTDNYLILKTDAPEYLEQLLRKPKGSGNWVVVALPHSDSCIINDIINIGGDSLFVLLEYFDSDTTLSKNGVYFSPDAGITWSSRNSGLPPALAGMTVSMVGSTACLSTLKLDTVAFDTYEVGGVFRSTNAGSSWTRITDGFGDSAFFVLLASNDKTFFGERYVFDGSVYTFAGISRSTDEGVTWTSANDGIDPVNTSVIEFASLDSVIIISMSQYNYISTDHGASWLELMPDYRYLIIEDLCKTNAGTLIATGHGVYLADEDLLTETDLDYSENGMLAYHYILTHVEGDHVYATDAYSDNDGTLLQRSLDAGNVWQWSELPLEFTMSSSPWVTINNRLFTGGQNAGNNRAVILEALSADDDWEVFLQLPRAGFVRSFDMIGDTIIAGIDGDDYNAYCYSSTNGGATWKLQSVGSTSASSIVIAKFIGPNLLVVDDLGYWFFSTDRGKTWSETLDGIPTPFVFMALAYRGATLVAVGNQYDFANSTYIPEIYLSNDNGLNWEIAVNGIPENVRLEGLSVDPTQSGVFYVSTDPERSFGGSNPTHSNVYVTTNSGISWTQFADDIPHASRLFVGDNYVFAQGVHGLYRAPKILGAVEDEMLVTKRRTPSIIAYPNPVLNRLSLSFSLPAASSVKIVLYDKLSKEIELLSSSYYPAGHYDVVYDMSMLPSGAYIVCLTAGVETAITSVVKVR